MNPHSSRTDQPEQFDNDSLADATEITTPGSEPTRDLEHSPASAPATGSVAAGTWVALILGALLLILLLVFILQNQDQVDINLFAWSFQLPAGIAYLFSAIVGAMIMALVGGWRMFELRRQLRKANH